MKKQNLSRVAAATLAGLMLVNPMMAAAESGVGGAEGDGSLPGISTNYVNFIFPTSSTKDAMLNFTIDPKGRLAGGSVEMNDRKIVAPDSAEPRTVTAADYDASASIYFQRINYDQIPMGQNERTAADYFGNIKNVVNNADLSQNGVVFSDYSNWIAIVNKSSVPVSVELNVDWKLDDRITLVEKKDDLTKTKDGKLVIKTPAIYMAVEMTDGYTVPIGTTAGKQVVGENFAVDEEDNLTYLSLLGKSSKAASTHKAGDTFYNYMRTANQTYKGAAADILTADIQAAHKAQNTTQPFYLKQATGGQVYLFDNTETYDKQQDRTWPVYGFRLTGAVNNVDGWEDADLKGADVKISLVWRLNAGQTTKDVPARFALNEKQTLGYNLNGVIDDEQKITVLHGTGDYKTTKITRVAWDWDGQLYDLWTEGMKDGDVIIDGTEPLSLVTVKEDVDADGNKNEEAACVHVRLLALMNWSENGFLNTPTDRVTLKIYLEGQEEPLNLEIYDASGEVRPQ